MKCRSCGQVKPASARYSGDSVVSFSAPKSNAQYGIFDFLKGELGQRRADKEGGYSVKIIEEMLPLLRQNADIFGSIEDRHLETGLSINSRWGSVPPEFKDVVWDKIKVAMDSAGIPNSVSMRSGNPYI